MTVQEFALQLVVFCGALHGSVTSWGRTTARNAAVGGVAFSAHRVWLAADVVYDTPVPEDEASALAERLDLRLIREGDHDHLQPRDWKK